MEENTNIGKIVLKIWSKLCLVIQVLIIKSSNIHCYGWFTVMIFLGGQVRRAHTPGWGSDNPPNANKSPRLAPGCTGWPRSQSCSRSSAGCSGQVRQVRPGCPSGPASRGTRPRAANPSHRPTLGCPPEGPRWGEPVKRKIRENIGCNKWGGQILFTGFFL